MVNLQNIPRDGFIRDVFVAEPGKWFVEADYSQAELRVLAELSRDEFLMQVYIDGRDLHDEMSLAMYGPNFSREQRIRAKAINFGIPYGRGPESISKEFKIPVVESRHMIRAWFDRAPQAEWYINRCRQAPILRKTLVTPFGRRRRFTMSTPESLFALQNEASNFPISSTASDLTLHSAIEIQQFLDQKWGRNKAAIVNIVHDSILVEAEEGLDPSEAMIDIMEAMPKKKIAAVTPFVADIKKGYRWGSLKG